MLRMDLHTLDLLVPLAQLNRSQIAKHGSQAFDVLDRLAQLSRLHVANERINP